MSVKIKNSSSAVRVGFCLFIVAVSCLLLIGYARFNKVSAQTAPANPSPGSSLADRVAQRKAEREIVLDERDARRIVQRCTRVQNNARRLQLPKTQMFDNRDKAYARASAKVWVAVGTIRLAEQDTFNLERYRLQLDEEIRVYRETVNNYKVTLEDILQINCEADAVGFMALIETLRIYDQQLADQAQKIRQTITVEVREELNSLTTKLQPQAVNE